MIIDIVLDGDMLVLKLDTIDLFWYENIAAASFVTTYPIWM
jgi:hypothetical protein